MERADVDAESNSVTSSCSGEVLQTTFRRLQAYQSRISQERESGPVRFDLHLYAQSLQLPVVSKSAPIRDAMAFTIYSLTSDRTYYTV
jgi:hypothetical protein